MRVFFAAFLLCSSQLMLGQLVGVSPYSSLGLGDDINGNPSRNFAIGGTVGAASDGYNINIGNPASYAKLKYTNFDLGVMHTEMDQQQGDLSIENGYTNFNYIVTSFPLLENLGLVFAVRPLTTRGFNILREDDEGELIGRRRTSIQGSGGINSLTIGTGWAPFKGLSIGVNANYYFGNNTDFTTSTLIDQQNAVGTRIEQEVRISTWQFETGIQYHRRIGKSLQVGIGGVYRMGNALNQYVTSNTFTVRPSANQIAPLDTLSSSIDVHRPGQFASVYTGGVSIGKINDERPLQYAWSVAVDYRQTMGSEFDGIVTRGEMVDASRISAGATIVPALAFSSLLRNKAFYNRTEYRIGAFLDEGHITVNNTNISALGMSFGVAIPLRIRGLAPGEVRNNMLNFTVAYGNRGTLDNNLVRERFTQFLIGITLTEKWFDKYKYR
ncbi:MAG: hypothetical protein LAT54_02805 [Cryomorphaceae bacterium]|nr:hypothetical protein [Cryomorphaceae bacterium]